MERKVNKMDYLCAALIVVAVMLTLFSVVVLDQLLPLHEEVSAIIEECEKELPKNQYCEYVITAKAVR